jgi:hypothetical protein
MTTNAIKGGTARTGQNRDKGIIVHIIPGEPNYGFWGTKAMCGATPGKRGYGWTDTSRPVTCPKCIKKAAIL